MSNIKDGLKFERELCQILSENGFWVHQVSQNSGGQQPADVFAVYLGIAYLIDCKVCSDDRFRFSRMEDNQRMAMDKWVKLKGTMPKFALKDSKGRIWMLDYQWAIAKEEAGHKGVACAKDGIFIVPLQEWLGWIT